MLPKYAFDWWGIFSVAAAAAVDAGSFSAPSASSRWAKDVVELAATWWLLTFVADVLLLLHVGMTRPLAALASASTASTMATLGRRKLGLEMTTVWPLLAIIRFSTVIQRSK